MNNKIWIGAIAVLIALIAFTSLTNPSTGVKHFTSTQQLANFLEANADENANTIQRGGATALDGKAGAESAQAPTPSDTSSSDYSITNVQIQGVDEPDFVKNDGKYIYIGRDANLTIVDAYPAENAAIQSITNINGTITSIFLNGDTLVVFGTEPYVYGGCPNCVLYDEPAIARASEVDIMPTQYNTPRSFVLVYDVTNRASPELESELYYDGNYRDARMIGSYVYLIANQELIRTGEDLALPSVVFNGDEEKIAATDIAYFPIADYGYQLTTVFALNLDSLDDLTKSSFLTGYTQTLFVSEKNIYLAAPLYVRYEVREERMLKEVILPSLSGDVRDQADDIMSSDASIYEKQEQIQRLIASYYNTLSEEEKATFASEMSDRASKFEQEWQKETQRTEIHKISIDGNDIEYIGKGDVPGTLLSQFSMDEHEGYLRVATTLDSGFWGRPMPLAFDSSEKLIAPSRSGTSSNNVYILDEDMNLVGALENLAEGERIYAVRFMGERAYVVTFKQIDPLFVIDLSDPRAPAVLGELKIPGYSTYLHMLDENTFIGIGQDSAGEIDEGGFMAAIPAGLKIGLFDISDPTSPQEIDTYIIGDRGTYSDALYDHKAFLLDVKKGLLVLPVNVQARVPSNQNDQFWYPTTTTFSGAYVFRVTTNGIELENTVTHLNATEQSQMARANANEYYYPPYEAQIQRSLYLGNTLYTLSQRALQANDMTTWDEQVRITLPHYQPVYYAYAGGTVSGVGTDVVAPVTNGATAE